MESNLIPVDKEKSFTLKKLLESLTHSGKYHLNKEELNKVVQICGYVQYKNYSIFCISYA